MNADGRLSRRMQTGRSRRELFRSVTGGLAVLLVSPAVIQKDVTMAQSPGAPSPGKAPAYASALQPALVQLLRELLAPSAAVVVQSSQLGDWAATFGTRTLAGTQPVTLGDHVRIGSNTKTMTGTVILQLVEEGKLRLDDPIAKYRSDVPNGVQITIAQLLNMRS